MNLASPVGSPWNQLKGAVGISIGGLVGCVAMFAKPTHPIWLILSPAENPPQPEFVVIWPIWGFFFCERIRPTQKNPRTFQNFEQNYHATLRISKDLPSCGGVNAPVILAGDDPRTRDDATFGACFGFFKATWMVWKNSGDRFERIGTRNWWEKRSNLRHGYQNDGPKENMYQNGCKYDYSLGIYVTFQAGP